MKKRKLLAVTLLSTILLNSAVPLVVADTSLRNNTSSTDQPTTADTDMDDESETAKKRQKKARKQRRSTTPKKTISHHTLTQPPPSNDTKQTDQASSEATDKPNKDKNNTNQPDSSDQSTPSPKDQSSQKESQNKDGRLTPSSDQQKDQTPDKTPEKSAEKTPEPNRDTPKPIQPPLAAASPVFAPWRESDKDLSKLKPSSRSSAAYVRHWTGDSAYTHNLLSRRYGITAEQLDGFLNSLGIHYDKERLNGKRLLEWEKLTGLDVRAIVAIAMAESSLGTQGVAKEKGANMFGYGAFDFNPNNAKKYSDEVAIRHMVEETIIANKNQTFERQDLKAKKMVTRPVGYLD